MARPSRIDVATFVPFLPVVAGLWLSSLRFRAHDSLGGLAFGLGGMILMFVLAIWLSRRE